MWTLTVAVGNIPWALMFKTEEKAVVAFNTATSPSALGLHVHIEDDFGQNLCAQSGHIFGAMLEDMDKSKLAHIERALHHARMQAEGQKAAQADATLRYANMQQGPQILSPQGMPNGFPRN